MKEWIWLEGLKDGTIELRTESGRPLAIDWQVLGVSNKDTVSSKDTSERFFLSSRNADWVIARARYPFHWAAFNNDTMIASGSYPFPYADTSNVLMTVANHSHPSLRAVALVSLQAAFLQVVTDLTSDVRVLLLYTNRGAFSRSLVLDTPFGILDAEVSPQKLLGVRRPDSLELVLYSWGWQTR